jgi:hypothetical protein
MAFAGKIPGIYGVFRKNIDVEVVRALGQRRVTCHRVAFGARNRNALGLPPCELEAELVRLRCPSVGIFPHRTQSSELRSGWQTVAKMLDAFLLLAAPSWIKCAAPCLEAPVFETCLLSVMYQMTFQRSLLFTFAITGLCVAISACANISLLSAMHECASCGLNVKWRLGTSAIGGLLLARFLIGTPTALRGPTAPTTYANGVIANLGTVRYRVGGKSSFFSMKRGAQLLGIILCIASQFIVFGVHMNTKMDERDQSPRVMPRTGQMII